MKTNKVYLILILSLFVVLSLKGCSDAKENALSLEQKLDIEAPDYKAKEIIADMSEDIRFTAPNMINPISANIDFVITKAANSENDGDKKFIRRANLRLNVKDIVLATHQIEDVIIGNKGFVIKSVIDNQRRYLSETRISKDSMLVRWQNRYTANLELKVRHTLLDETLRKIAVYAESVSYRDVTADEITFRLIGNEMEQQRKADKAKRLHAISGAGKGHKLEDLLSAEEAIDEARRNTDNAKLEELQLYDEVEYSLITIVLGEEAPVIQEVKKAIEKEPEAYRSNFFWKSFDAIKVGWSGLLEFVTILLAIWPAILIIGGIVYGIIIYRRKRKEK